MRMLDLFCGEGLAAWGYWRSGRFTEIVGVDIANMSSSYSFDFIQGDALKLDYDFLLSFDFIHASPPCQYYSKITPDRSKHLRLIPGTHLMLIATGRPYVIENVEGSGADLRPNLVLSGHDVGLPMKRKRYFHINSGGMINMSIDAHSKVGCREEINLSIDAHINLRSAVHIHGGQYVHRDTLIEAFGLETIPLARRRFLTCEGIEQGVPPAFTKLIAESMFPNKARIA